MLFRDILRIICHVDFEYGSINFHEQSKQLVKCQHMAIAHLMSVVKIYFEKVLEWPM